MQRKQTFVKASGLKDHGKNYFNLYIYTVF